MATEMVPLYGDVSPRNKINGVHMARIWTAENPVIYELHTRDSLIQCHCGGREKNVLLEVIYS